jgi:hypothetical protein
MASKTATTEAPSLRDLSQEVQRAAIRARAELADVRSRLSDLRSEREQLLSAPMHHTDLASELQRHIEAKARESAWFLRQHVQELRDRSAAMATTSPDEQAVYHPFDKAWLPEIVALLADPETAAKRILAVVGDDLDATVPEGLPIAERRAAVAALDASIAAAEEHEASLTEGLAAAGISLAMAA